MVSRVSFVAGVCFHSCQVHGGTGWSSRLLFLGNFGHASGLSEGNRLVNALHRDPLILGNQLAPSRQKRRGYRLRAVPIITRLQPRFRPGLIYFQL
ncbi:hypothetical protein BS47DRAFT_177120 [Hydnum rufescens UP504]|uniref:Uncharacterized protein n=1 Tax=Hydnum rufescens UP504 TaxID=1448309 RepID=A0A9P6ANR7_9AGAM|nr:hypothetical protein BS47DRAFT_177120 [Hydnum rufescens UP504]